MILFHYMKNADYPRQKIELPVTYRGLLKFTYKTNFLLIFKLSLLIALFSLPGIALLIMQGVFELAITSDVSLDASQIRERIMIFQGLYGFAYAIAAVILSVGLSGAFFLMRKQLWNEGVSFFRDFGTGIKKNWLSFIVSSLLFSFTVSIFNFALSMMYTDQLFGYYYLLFIIFIVLLIFLICPYLISLQMNTIYKVGFFRGLKNAVLLSLSNLPLILLSVLCSSALLVCAFFIPVPLAKFIIIGLYCLFGFGNGVLIVSIIDLYVFDETINKNQYPEIYRKSLFPDFDGKDGDGGA